MRNASRYRDSPKPCHGCAQSICLGLTEFDRRWYEARGVAVIDAPTEDRPEPADWAEMEAWARRFIDALNQDELPVP